MLGSQEFKSNMRFVSEKLKLPFMTDSALKRGEEGGKGGEVRERGWEGADAFLTSFTWFSKFSFPVT